MKSKDIMPRFLKYFLRGIKNFVAIGVPDFQTNNQFEDMQNISNDFKISYDRIVCNASQKAIQEQKNLIINNVHIK
ncbi:hypothetical protein [Sulfurimonas sp.]|uniref:hypothetical protein n=1 Tax=Sulfurimonas sp. TaxID=2022749 RepID=UPI0025CDD5A0|nr:hypothetical protein [Sulfurimonas sp.]